MRALSSEPYFSISPDSLAANGFARTEGDSAVYFAPDARTLTSAVFAQTHCMRAIQDRAKPEQIGLGFEPVAQIGLVDVTGVLWLDRASGDTAGGIEFFQAFLPPHRRLIASLVGILERSATVPERPVAARYKRVARRKARSMQGRCCG